MHKASEQGGSNGGHGKCAGGPGIKDPACSPGTENYAHDERAQGLAQSQDHTVDRHKGPPVFQGRQPCQQGLDAGDIDALGNAEDGDWKEQQPQAGHKRENDQGHGIEEKGRLEERFLAIHPCQSAQLGGGESHRAGHAGHDQADNNGGGLKGMTEQEGEKGQI